MSKAQSELLKDTEIFLDRAIADYKAGGLGRFIDELKAAQSIGDYMFNPYQTLMRLLIDAIKIENMKRIFF